MTSDSLYIYSNAIFGADNERLSFVEQKENEYTFLNAKGDRYVMNFDYRKEETNAESLSIIGPDYKISLLPLESNMFTSEGLAFYHKKRVAPCAEHYFSGRWYGKIIRTSDNQSLSNICMEFIGDTLHIYSNAIFGYSNEELYNIDFENGAFVYANASDEKFQLKPRYNGTAISLTGDDFHIEVEPFEGEWDEAMAFYQKRKVPRNADFYFSGRWHGKIIRTSDNQSLSNICMEFIGDTLYVYSNAIFGRSNEELYNIDFENGTFVYANASGEKFQLIPQYNGTDISLTGDDFRIEVEPLEGKWDEAMAFYLKQEVARNADGYLFGTYVGKINILFPMADMLGILSGVGTGVYDMEGTMTLEFLEGNRCRVSMKAALTDPRMKLLAVLSGGNALNIPPKVSPYKVEGNQFRCGGDLYYIQPDGSIVLPSQKRSGLEMDKVVLRKQY